MKEFLDKKYCTGCEACYNICSYNAITMIRDAEGFDYPSIDQSKCIDCGLCERICPVLHYNEKTKALNEYNDVQKAFASKIKNDSLRKISSSGGMFPAIARYILEHDGLVVGAAFNDSFDVFHKIVRDTEHLHEIQSSKYAQSKIGTVYREIKKELINGKLVLFAGMACQVEGLKSFLRKDYEHLYTIDLICMGIPSPGVWKAYLKVLFENETIKSINFKDKTFGWRTFSLRIETNKRTFLEKGFDNAFFECMFKHYSLRPSCFTCPFKKEKRFSDFTLADCWGSVKEVPQLDDNKGLSSVIVHSNKGLKLWHQISKDVDSAPITIKSIALNNSNLIKNQPPRTDRYKFYKLFNKSPRLAFNKYGNNPNKSIKVKMISKVKRLISKLLK